MISGQASGKAINFYVFVPCCWKDEEYIAIIHTRELFS